jgi:hypothetical protein
MGLQAARSMANIANIKRKFVLVLNTSGLRSESSEFHARL